MPYFSNIRKLSGVPECFSVIMQLVMSEILIAGLFQDLSRFSIFINSKGH